VRPPVKLSKADWKPYALIKKMLQIEHKLAKEKRRDDGWNVTEETTAVTEQFCAAVNKPNEPSPPPIVRPSFPQIVKALQHQMRVDDKMVGTAQGPPLPTLY